MTNESAGDLLRKAAQVVDDSVLHESDLTAIKLMALHAMRYCGARNVKGEAEMLISLLERDEAY
jgi:hypothetical protein